MDEVHEHEALYFISLWKLFPFDVTCPFVRVFKSLWLPCVVQATFGRMR